MIYNYAAGIVTMDDVKKYFKGDSFPRVEHIGDEFTAISPLNIKVDLKKGPELFDVQIESVDDPSDSEKGKTSDPLKFINEFISQGVPGGTSMFSSLSQKPDSFSQILIKFSSSIESSAALSKNKVARILRRLLIASMSKTGDSENYEVSLSKVEKKLKDKGWKTKATGDEIVVDIGDGIYEASIKKAPDDWNYKFELISKPSTIQDGKTEDPIEEFRKWKKQPHIKEAWLEWKSEKAEDMDAPTVAPNRK